METPRREALDDQLVSDLEDKEPRTELELMAKLIIAASRAPAPMPQGQLDRALGLARTAAAPSQHPVES